LGFAVIPRFDAPAVLLLALPALVLYAKLLRPRQARLLETALHVVLILLLIAALAGPYVPAPSTAVDLVVLVDRSRSMPQDADRRIGELIEFVERQREAGMRVGIVAAGNHAHVEQMPQEHGKFAGFAKAVDPDASNLAEGLETAVNLVGAGRAGKILVFSDGLATGRSPLPAASMAAARDIAVDYRSFERPRVNDVAVERLSVPAETDAGASFQWTAWVRSDGEKPVKYRCFRDEAVIAEGETRLAAGSRPLYFRDRLPQGGGLHLYRVEIRSNDDPVPENNTAVAVLRAHDAPRVLVATQHPAEDNVSRALRTAGFRVDHVPAGSVPRDLAGLDPYRVVVLEDVPVNGLGAQALVALRSFVEDGGGGLLITGGKASFGVGGYFKSDLDPLIPVSMEMRQEHRKFRMAMAVALDRSGSMAVPVGGGLQKMDLANRGAAEAIQMLTPMDEVAVIAVDSAAHLMVPLIRVEDPKGITQRVLKIRSEGGGIFVYTALLAAGKALEKSTAGTRHIVLFADAADAEEPGDYKTLMGLFAKAGITVSVIGLGTDKDSDAEFLKDVARRGNGRIFFTNKPEDLPRLFAQETLSVARSSFIDEPVAGKWMPDVHLLGEVGRTALPKIGGYNLTYPKPNAAIAAITEDEYKAPLVAFWHRGVGRVAAVTPEMDGPTSASLLAWPGYGALASGLGRWLMGGDEPEGVSLSMKVEEPDVRLVLEFDPASEAGKDIVRQAPALSVLTTTEGGRTEQLPFQWTGERSLEARFSMEREGIYLPVARLAGGQVVKAPPVTLPYSPEFLPRRMGSRREGQEMLEEIAARTGGRRRDTLEGVFDVPHARIRDRFPLRMALAVAALALLLLEVAARRLSLWDLAFLTRVEGALRSLATRVPVKRAAPPEAPAPAAPTPPPPSEAPPVAPPAPAAPTLSEALDAAKRRSRRRYEK
jgi:uncharacterized membrane protein